MSTLSGRAVFAIALSAVVIGSCDEETVSYRVEHVALPGERWGPARTQPAWLAEGVELSGRQLAVHGLRPPVLHPESAVLVHLTTGPPGTTSAVRPVEATSRVMYDRDREVAGE